MRDHAESFASCFQDLLAPRPPVSIAHGSASQPIFGTLRWHLERLHMATRINSHRFKLQCHDASKEFQGRAEHSGPTPTNITLESGLVNFLRQRPRNVR